MATPRPLTLLALCIPLWLGACAAEDAPERRSPESRRVRVEPLRVDATGSPVLVLSEAEGLSRRLPIWIGLEQARSIQMALEGRHPPRPNTHDLVVRLLSRLNTKIVRVTVTDLRGSTYHALIELANGTAVDARPSDAIALALRSGTPVFVAEAVLDGAFEPEEAENSQEILWRPREDSDRRAPGFPRRESPLGLDA